MIQNISRYVKLLRKYNKLETEYETLKEEVKDGCFKIILEKIGEPDELKRLRNENRRLRLKVKDLKKRVKY
jgi:cell division septum initiation protein DivIVA